MSSYNTGKKYNISAIDGGLTYNYQGALLIIKITENIRLDDSEIRKTFAKINITETLSLKEAFQRFGNVQIADNFRFQETEKITGIVETIDEILMRDDVIELINLIKFSDSLNLVDREPRKAVTDFVIGKIDGLDNRYIGISPFDMYYIERESDIPVMPTTESTYIDIPNVDGSIVQNTIYTNRFMSLVLASVQGLQPDELEIIKQKITKILDSTKDEHKLLTDSRNDTTFEVKYSGSAIVQQGASWIKATIPFEAKPYGRRTFPYEFSGNGIILNNGDNNVGAIITIDSGCINPNFKIGDVEFLWSGTVPQNKKLVIDNENLTCYLVSKLNSDLTENAMTNLTKGSEFIKVKKGKSLTLTCLNNSTLSKIETMYNPLILWYGKD